MYVHTKIYALKLEIGPLNVLSINSGGDSNPRPLVFRTTEAPSTTTEVGSTSVGTVEETTESLLDKLKLMEEENEKLEAKINGLKQEYEKIGLQVTTCT
jgi:hypothetical protein